MDSLRLTFPAQQQGHHLLVETQAEALRHWLEGLPYGDMKRTVPQVTQAIASLNRTELPVSQRAELLPLFDHTYDLINDYYRPRILMRPRGQQFASRSETEELQQLTREMSFAYKLLTTETIAKRSFWTKDKPLVRAINLAIHYLGLILMEHYETYSPIPIYTWRELNVLYAYASKNKLNNQEVMEAQYKHCLPRIDDSYARICLIALANPYQMDRSEHWEMNRYLSNWCGLARISSDTHDYATRSCFVIDLSTESKPNYGVTINDSLENPHLRLLVTEELTRQLHQQIQELEQEHKLPQPGFFPGISQGTALTLLQRMHSHWDFRVDRIAPRYPVINQLDVIWSLSKIHLVISAQDPLATNTDVRFREGGRDALASLLNEMPGQLRWDTINASDTGICIAQHWDSIDQLRVGQVAALREYADGKPLPRWQLGIVRWLRGDKRKGTSVGLQFIKGEAQAIMLRTRTGNRIESSWQTALLVSGEEVHGLASPTIVANKGLYHDGRAMVVQIGDEEMSVRARMRVESSPLVERFFYQGYVHDESEDAPASATATEQISLDNIPLPGDH